MRKAFQRVFRHVFGLSFSFFSNLFPFSQSLVTIWLLFCCCEFFATSSGQQISLRNLSLQSIFQLLLFLEELFGSEDRYALRTPTQFRGKFDQTTICKASSAWLEVLFSKLVPCGKLLAPIEATGKSSQGVAQRHIFENLFPVCFETGTAQVRFLR